MNGAHDTPRAGSVRAEHLGRRVGPDPTEYAAQSKLIGYAGRHATGSRPESAANRPQERGRYTSSPGGVPDEIFPTCGGSPAARCVRTRRQKTARRCSSMTLKLSSSISSAQLLIVGARSLLTVICVPALRRNSSIAEKHARKHFGAQGRKKRMVDTETSHNL